MGELNKSLEEFLHPPVLNYVKRPVVISALIWSGSNIDDVIKFCKNKHVDYDKVNGLHIYTLEGRMKADIGDYIIEGVAGEHYACKPDIFKLTYERI